MVSTLLTIAVLATVALVAVLVKCEPELYPDVSCLPDLYDETTRKGVAHVRKNAMICEKQKGRKYNRNWQNCSKSCAWMRLEIANWTAVELQPVNEIKVQSHMKIVKTVFSAEAIAERISTCDGALKAVANRPCEEWDEFYSCMDAALGC